MKPPDGLIGGPAEVVYKVSGFANGLGAHYRRPALVCGGRVTAIIHVADLVREDTEQWGTLFMVTGYRPYRINSMEGSGWFSRVLTFQWVEHGGVYVPPHWITRGLAKCAAYHRIFGPNEGDWPEEYWDELTNASRAEAPALAG